MAAPATVPRHSGPLAFVPADRLFQFSGLDKLYRWANQDDPPPRPGLTAAFCKITLPACGVARFPADIRAAHRRSQDHMKLPPEHAVWANRDRATFFSGHTRPERTCTADQARLALALAPLFGYPKMHLNRGWERDGCRFFEGLLHARDDYQQPAQPWTRLRNQRDLARALHGAGAGPALFELPHLHPGDHPNATELLVFAYRRGGPGMTLPHGIAPSYKRLAAAGSAFRMHNWHVEPGGAVIIALTCNHPDLGSAGYFVTPDYDKAAENFAQRVQKPTYRNLHDKRLLDSGLPLDLTNFVCASLNTLPLTWAGKLITDPLVVSGQGSNNKHFFSGDFVLPDGDNDLPPDDHWPHGVRPPQALRQFLARHRIRLRRLFLAEAHRDPRAFLCLFPSFAARPALPAFHPLVRPRDADALDIQDIAHRWKIRRGIFGATKCIDDILYERNALVQALDRIVQEEAICSAVTPAQRAQRAQATLLE
jgi:hypothetical protein